MQRPESETGRPGGTACDASTTIKTNEILQRAHLAEVQRRARLVRDLHRVADRLHHTDRESAALARFFARTVAC